MGFVMVVALLVLALGFLAAAFPFVTSPQRHRRRR